MPIIDVKLLEGRSKDQKRRLVAAITQAVVESLDVKPELVRIVLHKMDRDNYAVGGVLTSDQQA